MAEPAPLTTADVDALIERMPGHLPVGEDVALLERVKADRVLHQHYFRRLAERAPAAAVTADERAAWRRSSQAAAVEEALRRLGAEGALLEQLMASSAYVGAVSARGTEPVIQDPEAFARVTWLMRDAFSLATVMTFAEMTAGFESGQR